MSELWKQFLSESEMLSKFTYDDSEDMKFEHISLYVNKWFHEMIGADENNSCSHCDILFKKV